MKKQRYIIVTAAVIIKEGKILITQRPKGVHLEGMWEFPGGKKEDSETLEQCMRREIMEELGIKIVIEKKLIEVQHEYETKFVELHFFQCAVIDGSPSPKEGQKMKWVEPETLLNYRFPPPDREIINYIIKNQRKFKN